MERKRHDNLDYASIGLVLGVCRGSLNVQLMHETTLEFAREDFLTVRGDCVACIRFRATNVTNECKGNVQVKILILSPPWKNELHTVVVRCRHVCNAVEGNVTRRSMFCDERTIAMECDAAARDIPRYIRDRLADNFSKVYVVIKCVDISR